MAIALRYAARSDVGLVRTRNEDSAYAGPHLLALADGMGGHAGGDVASSLAIGDLVHLDGESHGGDDALGLLRESLRSANDSLRREMADNPEVEGMGTTVIAMLRTGDKLALAHLGDSRAYLLRAGTFTQITHDHSFVQGLVDEGRITAAEAEHHPQRSLVTRVLTGHPGDEPDLSIREARPGDRYLICSDGLSDFVGADTIGEVLGAAANPAAAADGLVQLALRAGAPDNVTCVVADVVDHGKEPAPSTAPEVVGAAAQRAGRATRAIPVSPAEKAAALSRQASPDSGEPDEDESGHLLLAEEGPSSRRATWLKRAAVLVLVLAVLGAGGYAAYSWSQRQYYVGSHHGFVAVYRGVAQDVGPLQLSHLESETAISLTDLPAFYRDKVADTFSAKNLADARRIVDDLLAQAVACRAKTAGGGACG